MSTTTIKLPYEPYAHQRAAHVLRLTTRFVVLVWHRRAGKTVFAVLELLMAALAFKGTRGRFGYVAPLLKQSKAVAWDYLKSWSRLIPGAVINESELYVEFPNDTRVRLFGADNPDGMRGIYFDGVVLDEGADMKPETWGEIVRPALADRNGWALFIGTPKGVNLFSELFYRAQKEEGWAADLKRASDTGVISVEEIEQARREMSPAQFAQEFDCDFAAAVDNVLLPLDIVLAAQKRSLGESGYLGAAKVLGIDVARYGDDSSVFFLRQGQVAFRPRVTRGADTMTVAGIAAQMIDELHPDACFIDVGGVGAGVFDRLKQLGHEATPVDFGGRAIDPRFENKRAEMWWLMADWCRTGCLPEGNEIQRDLTGPKYTYANKRGRLQLESKDEMRSRGMPSPDYADALACTFAYPVAPAGLRVGRSQQMRHEYNPLQGDA